MSKFMRHAGRFAAEHLALLTILVCVSALILVRSYFYGVFISWDSTHYLRTAQEILAGNGFFAHPEWSHFYGNGWFAVWPIGYSFLIAVVAFVTRAEIYLASKLLSILVVWIIGLTFAKRFGRGAWLYALVMFHFGFLHIFYFTWSEVPFLLGLVLFSFWVSDVITEEQVKVSLYIKLTLGALLLFTSRYIGAFAFGVIGLLWLYNLYLFGKRKDNTAKKRLVGLTASGALSGAFMLGYLFLNHRMTGYITGSPNRPVDNPRWLVNNLYEAQLAEMNHVFDTFFNIEALRLALPLWSLFFGFVGYTIRKSGKAIRGRETDVITPLVFLAVGGIYWCAIVAMRFAALFDDFSYRLLFPSTALLFIGCVGLLIRHRKPRPKPSGVPQGIIAGCLFLFVLFSLIPTVTNPHPWGYRELQRETLTAHAHIPDGAVVVWGSPNLIFLREDLAFTFDLPNRLPANLDVDGFFEMHEPFSEVHVYIPRMRAYMDSALSGHAELLAFFEQYRYSEEILVRIR